MKERVIKELKRRGYEASLTSTIKNGVKKDGVSIKRDGSRVAQIIYPLWEKLEKVEEIVELLINTFEENENPQLEQGIETLLSLEYIKENVFIALQKESDEPIVKEACYPGIEAYLRVITENIGVKGTYKITKQMLESLKADETELWNIAYENLKKSVTVIKMSEVLEKNIRMSAEFLGIPEEALEEMIEEIDENPMYVFSLGNPHNGQYGASAILHEEKLDEICERHNVNKLLICPSSIHEAIVMPYTGEKPMDDASRIVREVNKEAVDPEEQLSDEAFIYELK